MSFWHNVEAELEYKNMSRKELAQRAHFAVSGMSLGLANNSTPNVDVAVRIADVLDVSVEYLVTGTERRIYQQENSKQFFHLINVLGKLSLYDLNTIHLLATRMLERHEVEQ